MAVGAVVALLAVAFAFNAVFGVHEGPFELDGDAVVNDGRDDWANVLLGDGGDSLVSTGLLTDPVNSGADTIYTTGGSKDTNPIDSGMQHWKHTLGNSPDKNDIEHAFAALYEFDNDGDGSDDQIVYFGLDRFDASGDAAIGFWFLQDDVAPGPDGDWTGQHMDGDTLVQVDFTNGGAIERGEVFQWQGSDATGSLVSVLSTETPGVEIECSPALTDDPVCVIINDATVASPWTYVNKDLAGDDVDFPADTFFEGGLDLSEFFSSDLPCFSTFIAETRTSQSETAQLKDYVTGNFDTCGSIEVLKYLDSNGNGQRDPDEPPLAGWEMTLSDGDGVIASDVTNDDGIVVFGELEPGDYTVSETLQSGWVNTDPGDGTLSLDVPLGLAEDVEIEFGNVSPALSVTKECVSDDVFLNEQVDFEIVVSNDGNVDLDVEIVDLILDIDTTVAIPAGGTYPINDGVTAGSVGTITNTVMVSSDDFPGVTLEDDASCSTDVHQLTVDKDGVGARTDDYDWSVVKTADPTEIHLYDGQSDTIDWTVTVDVSGPEIASQSLTGTITVTNPHPTEDADVVVSDSYPTATVAVDCGGGDGNGTVPAGGSLDCSYTATAFAAGGLLPGTNTASVDHVSNPADALEPIVFSIVETDTCVNITDDFPVDSGLNGVELCADAVADGGTEYSYDTDTDPCDDGNDFTVDNTASLGDGQDADDPDDNSDDADVDVFCYTPSVTKTALGTYTETHTWTVEKSVDPGSQNGFAGDVLSWEWDVDVSETTSTSNYRVTGVVTITNPNPESELVVALTDAVNATPATAAFAPSATCDAFVDGALKIRIPADGVAECSYTATGIWDTLAAAPTQNRVDIYVPDGGEQYTHIEPVTYSVGDIVDETAELTDDQGPLDETLAAGDGPWEFTYTGGATCPTDFSVYDDNGEYSVTVDNVAVLDPSDTGSLQDDASTTYTCYLPSISKTAAGTYDEVHDWEVEKTVDPESQQGFAGETVDFDWTITVTETVTEGNFDVAGAVTVNNPRPDAALVVTLTDSLSDGTAVSFAASATCDISGSTLTVADGATAVCDYTVDDLAYSDVGDAPTLNEASIGWNGLSLDAADAIGWDANVIDADATLDDDQFPYVNEPVSDGWTTTYPGTYTCSSDANDYTNGEDLDNTVSNTAIVNSASGEEDRSTAITEIDCYLLSIDKDVTPHFTRTYEYRIDKEARLPADGVININFGESHIITWDVVLSEAGISDTGFNIDTTVTVTNPSDRAAIGVSVTDSIPGITLDCAWSDGLISVIAPNSSVVCTSTADPVSGDVTSNTATVSAYGVDHDSATAEWAFDTPDTEVNKTVNVQDAFGPGDADLTGRLDPQPTTYTWGDGAGEPVSMSWTLMTLVSTDADHQPDLLLGCGYTAVENDAAVIGDGDIVLDSDTAIAPVDVMCGTACTLTQGYWRTHSAAGPKGNHDAYVLDGNVWKHRDDTWDSVAAWDPTTLSYVDWDGDGVFEGEEEDFFGAVDADGNPMTWWQVQWEAPQGHFYFNLAHQWIATHLNVWQEANEAFGGDFEAAFATLPSEVQDADDAAVAYFESTDDPYGRLKGQAKKSITEWHGTLASFNEGYFPGWPHCDENTEAEVDRFARLVGLY